MRIALLLKQVPQGQVAMNQQTGDLDRSTVEGCLNSYDYAPLEWALQLKERLPEVTIHAFTMGPKSAKAVLQEALVLGADQGIHLTDRYFAGADALATAHTLAQGLQTMGGYDLVLCGMQSTDGDTAQVSGEVASLLGVDYLPWVCQVESVTENGVHVWCQWDGGRVEMTCDYPLLASVMPGLYTVRMPTLAGRVKGKKKPIATLDVEALGGDRQTMGKAGSATKVVAVSQVESPPCPPLLQLDPDQCKAWLEEVSQPWR